MAFNTDHMRAFMKNILFAYESFSMEDKINFLFCQKENGVKVNEALTKQFSVMKIKLSELEQKMLGYINNEKVSFTQEEIEYLLQKNPNAIVLLRDTLTVEDIIKSLASRKCKRSMYKIISKFINEFPWEDKKFQADFKFWVGSCRDYEVYDIFDGLTIQPNRWVQELAIRKLKTSVISYLDEDLQSEFVLKGLKASDKPHYAYCASPKVTNPIPIFKYMIDHHPNSGQIYLNWRDLEYVFIEKIFTSVEEAVKYTGDKLSNMEIMMRFMGGQDGTYKGSEN